MEMSKNILDDIIESNEKDVYRDEDEILFHLLDEINLIKDEDIRSFIRSVLLKAEMFWLIPSSFSGKYHPPDEHNELGNVIHTKRVVRIACTMADSYVLSDEERDIVIAACLLHDATKGIKSSDSNSFHYDPMHPYTVQKLIESAVSHDKEYGNDGCSTTLFLQEEAVQTILRLIRCHLGPWSPVPETYPITYLDYIVHLSDNIASKLHTYIEDSDLINEKWRKVKATENS
jgi:HD superfamily phosphohydrolase YqeK